ncbi:unnamed protein product [Brassicogethes aeneus]|uniref:Deoxyribodipyrimidine photo-lyase n=1 Tax=Brassicogethes aeneus TaxID=1431903 RepID=A0A9P0BFZ4_BRAAE|nr:unnamed protein product [Brassicogethes aeneus]
MASLKPKNASGAVLLSKLTKDVFIKNISEARAAEGDIEHFCFNKSRLRVVSKTDDLKKNSKGIIYLMSRDCRVEDNWAVLYSQKLALQNKLPLHICVLTKEFNCLYPTKRHLHFALEGFKEIQKECEVKKIGFHFLKANVKDFVKIVEDNQIGAVVLDFDPLKKPVEWRNYLKDNLDKNVALIEVDAHNIVPAWLASEKQEVMAKTIRPKITKQLPEYLTGFPEVCKHNYQGKLDTDKKLKNVDDVYDFYKPLYDVEIVKWAKPGAEGAYNTLLSFMQERLQYYGISSNDPSKNHTSNLSPWIRFGHIAAQRVALEVKSVEKNCKEQVDKYLEELIVRRELAENYCFYNSNYDNINGAAEWARKTLLDHKSDKRVYTYTRDQFEKALTHDEMWNAATLQLVQEGKIHGYMRMYWCKKILEWTKTPEEAIEIGLWLNDTFSLDGTCPNGFVGVMWSICCVHDQGWGEREIFGKIRFMVDYSLKRKFNMEAYCARFGRSIGKTSAKKGVKRKAK